MHSTDRVSVHNELTMSLCMTKPTKWHARPAKIQISLSIRPVWSEFSLSAWRKLGSLATHWVQAKTVIRLGGCPGWPEPSLCAHVISLVLSFGGSNFYECMPYKCIKWFQLSWICFIRYWVCMLHAWGMVAVLQGIKLSHLMRLRHFSSSVNSFFKCACAGIQWG